MTYRYDAVKFPAFLNNNIWAFAEDPDGQIWVGCDENLFLFDPARETITPQFEPVIRAVNLDMARSLDRGATITKNLKVDEGTCVCCRTAVTSGPEGMVYVAWRKIFEGNVRETVVARSTDHGETFEAPVIVGHDQWVFPACPHRPASMGVDRQGRLYVVWYTEGTDEIPAVYIAYSDDRGKSFSEKRKLNVSKNTFPDHPQIAVDPEGRIVVVWEEQAPVKRDVVMSVSMDRGATFTAPHKVNEKKSQTPVVAVNSQGLFALAWMEHGMPGHKIVMQTVKVPSVKVAAEPVR